MDNKNTPFPPGAAVVFYGRDSGGSKQNLSVTQQEAVVQDWCKTNDYNLTRIFADTASGGSTAGRDQFDAMMAYFLHGASEAGVVFWDLSRWARNFDDGQYFLASLRRQGYQAHSLEEYIPPGSIGKVVESLHLWAAEEYREQLSRNVKRGLHYMITVHKAYPRPHISIGYKKQAVTIGLRRDGKAHVINRLIPDPATADRVRQAFEMRAAGYSIEEIHKEVKLYKTAGAYHHLFRKELYIGVFTFGGVRVEDFCEPLVDLETWDTVQEINRKWGDQQLNARRITSSFLLSGLAYCDICGALMTGRDSKQGGRRYYRCSMTNNTNFDKRCQTLGIKDEVVDKAVLQAVHDALQEDAILDVLAEAIRAIDKNDPIADELAQVELQTERNAQAIANVTRAIEEHGHSQALLSRLFELEKEYGRKQTELNRLRAREIRHQRSLEAMQPGEIQKQALAAKMQIRADRREQQLAIRALVREVRLAKTKDGRQWGTVKLILPGTEIEIERELAFI